MDVVRETSIRIDENEEIIRVVHSHHWREIQRAIWKYSMIEIEGMGRFIVREKKLVQKKKQFEKMITSLTERLEKIERNDRKWYGMYTKLRNAKHALNILNDKHTKDIGRNQE